MPRAARGADHRARQHRLHGGQRAGLPDRARRAVEAREDAELAPRGSRRGWRRRAWRCASGRRAPARGRRRGRRRGCRTRPAPAARSMRSSMALTGVTLSIDLRLGRASCSNSRMSAPTMKPFSLPEMKTRPRIDLSRAPCLDALDDRAQLLERPPAERILALALAVEHRPGDALACRSEKRQSSQRQFMSQPWHSTVAGLEPTVASSRYSAAAALCMAARVVARRHVVRLHLGRIEVIDGDDARGQRLDLAQQRALARR